MWKNLVEPDRSQMTIRRMRIACWITKAIHTQTHKHTHKIYIPYFSIDNARVIYTKMV